MLYITPSLINSWQYGRKSDEKAEEFLRYLRREPVQPTPAMLAGIEWEQDIQSLTSKMSKKELLENFAMAQKMDMARYSVALFCKYGTWQVPIFSEILLPFGKVGIKGKIDVLKKSLIIDLKRSRGYDTNKYVSSLQHSMYMYCTGINRFTYVIAYGNGGDVAMETYRMTTDMHDYMCRTMQEFITDIDRRGLMDVYRNNWDMTPEQIREWREE